MIDTVDEARQLLARARVVSLVATPGFTSLVEAVAGPVKGSWWGHPRGDTIYAIATALEDEALVARLAAGKVAFLHRSLWPALLRVVTDGDFRTRARSGLPGEAGKLLVAVERAGRLRLADLPAEKATLRKARATLEARLLVHAASEHTDKGHHEAVLRTWADWAAPETTQAAAKLSYLAAEQALAEVGVRLVAGKAR
jgi:hypothetical protein